MLTGLRTIELRSSEWADIDFDKGVWNIPAERMKMRRPHIVPISSQVQELLEEIRQITGRGKYVFPGRNDAGKPMSEASINQVIKRIGYDGKATGHGFRHTMSTILHEQGYNTAWIETQLAHVDKNSIRGTYNHAQYLDGRREMLQWYADYAVEGQAVRDRTRSHTGDLPSIGLKFLADMRHSLANAEMGTQIYAQTELGTLYIFRQADSYASTINGVARAIRITTTQAGYGVRYWYLCPHCCTRVAKLYIGQRDIACRKCWKLHYASQSEDGLARMRRNIRRQRFALWGNTEQTRNLFNRPHTFPKPKGMRWETFDQRVAALERSENAYFRAFAPAVDKICGMVKQ